MAYDWKTDLPGVFSRHADYCPARDGDECTCGPLGYRSSVRDWKTNERTVGPTFETAVEAVAWQRDQLVSDTPDRERTVGRANLSALIDEFLQAADDGMVRDARGDRYTRESVRALRGALSYAASELGAMNVEDIRRRHVQGLVNQLSGSGVAPTRIEAVTDALRGLYAYAVRRDLVGFSPVVELQFPLSSNGGPSANGGPPQAPDPASAPAGFAAPPPSTPSEPWTAPPHIGPPWTQPPFDAYGRTSGELPVPPYTPPPPLYPAGYPPNPTAAYPPPYDPAAYAAYAASRTPVPTPTPGPWPYESGGFTGMLTQQPGNPTASYDSTMQERWLWWTVRIVVIVFVLIALVLVAESV